MTESARSGTVEPELIAAADEAFRSFIADPAFPCLAGKGAVRQQSYRVGVYGPIAAADSAVALTDHLREFILGESLNRNTFSTFAAIFVGPAPSTEREFEGALWDLLRRVHERDSASAAWDPTVSSDPDDPRFSFSIAGHACFVVGLHPHSSRLARRFQWPALVFNPHAQFERLRAEGHYDKLRDTIRARDIALQGDVNPNLADFGEISEARQYSGRRTEPNWQCPFHAKPG